MTQNFVPFAFLFSEFLSSKLKAEDAFDLNGSSLEKFKIIAFEERFFTVIEIFMSEVESEEEKETELDSMDGVITDTVKSVDEEIFSFFQGKLALDIPKGIKERKKSRNTKNLLKIATKVAFKTWQELNSSVG